MKMKTTVKKVGDSYEAIMLSIIDGRIVFEKLSLSAELKFTTRERMFGSGGHRFTPKPELEGG